MLKIVKNIQKQDREYAENIKSSSKAPKSFIFLVFWNIQFSVFNSIHKLEPSKLTFQLAFWRLLTRIWAYEAKEVPLKGVLKQTRKTHYFGYSDFLRAEKKRKCCFQNLDLYSRDLWFWSKFGFSPKFHLFLSNFLIKNCSLPEGYNDFKHTSLISFWQKLTFFNTKIIFAITMNSKMAKIENWFLRVPKQLKIGLKTSETVLRKMDPKRQNRQKRSKKGQKCQKCHFQTKKWSKKVVIL